MARKTTDRGIYPGLGVRQARLPDVTLPGLLHGDPWARSIAEVLTVCDQEARRILQEHGARSLRCPALPASAPPVAWDAARLLYLVEFCREAVRRGDAEQAALYGARLGQYADRLHVRPFERDTQYGQDQRALRKRGGTNKATGLAWKAARVCELVEKHFAEHGRKGNTEAAYLAVAHQMTREGHRISSGHVKKLYLAAKARKPAPRP